MKNLFLTAKAQRPQRTAFSKKLLCALCVFAVNNLYLVI